MPAAQGEHADEPTAENVPAGQDTQIPATAYVPPGQSEQTASPALENLPLGQMVHAVDPRVENIPDRHVAHDDVDPTMDAYFPSVH